MGNFFSDMFGGSNNSKNNIAPSSISAMTPQQQSVVNFLSGVVNNGSATYGQGYTGPRVAPMSTFQRQGMGSLQSYLDSSGVTPGMTNIQDFLSKTINGSYDPATNPQYQAYAAQAGRNNAAAVSGANADFGSRGQFFSTAAVNKIGDITAQTTNSLNATNAELMNQERNRQMSAVGPASSLEQYIAGIPLQKTSAALSYGALPQQLDQQQLEANYQDFIRQQNQVSSAASGVMSSPQNQLYYPKQTQSMFSQLSPMLGNFMTSDAGQGALASLGGMASGAGASMAGAGSSLMSFLGPLMAFL